MSIENSKQLNEAIKQLVLKPLITTLAEKIVEKLVGYVADNWYNKTQQSEFYDRTYDFLTSIISSEITMKGFDFAMEVYIDYEKMEQISPTQDKFGSRVSLDNSRSYDGKSISYWLIQWIEEGQGSPVHSYKGIHMFKNVSKELETELDDYIIKSFNELKIKYVKGVI